MKKLIYFVGGVSAAGKSTVTKKLSDMSGHRIVALDDLYNFLRASMNDRRVSKEVTRKITIDIIEQFLAFETTCITEGGWILPDKAKELKDRHGEQFYPVFCGYPNADVSERMRLIKSGKVHWLCETSKEYLITWVQEQAEESQWFQDECAKYKLPFFDFSNVEEGSAALMANYTQWCGAELNKQINLPPKKSVKKQKSSLVSIRSFLGRLTKH
jgi:2-phosphoglycerate kinase